MQKYDLLAIQMSLPADFLSQHPQGLDFSQYYPSVANFS